MKNPIIHRCSLLSALVAGIVAWHFAAFSLFAYDSEEALKAFMIPYGKIEAALAKDDLAAARQAAKALPQDKDAKAIASSKSLEEAREAFKNLSKKAVSMVRDKEGYYVFSCPMMKDGYWVQTSPRCANPYQGKTMLGCGNLLDKKQAAKISEWWGWHHMHRRHHHHYHD